MGLFHRLQDVYFDTERLSQELAQIPAECDCPRHLQLSGQCCCASSARRAARNAGCLKHLEQLSREVNLMIEDIHHDLGRLRKGEDSRELNGQISLVENSIWHLHDSLDHIRKKLLQPAGGCAHEDLIRLKERSGALHHYAQSLNKVI